VARAAATPSGPDRRGAAMSTAPRPGSCGQCRGQEPVAKRARNPAPLRGRPTAEARRFSNQSALAGLRAKSVQAKLSVNAPGDRYERRGRSLADAGCARPRARSPPVGDSISQFLGVQRRSAARNGRKRHNARAAGGGEGVDRPVMPRGPGQPLPKATRDSSSGASRRRHRQRARTNGWKVSLRALGCMRLAYTVGSASCRERAVRSAFAFRRAFSWRSSYARYPQQGIDRRVQRACGTSVPMPGRLRT
jgi:hypothetical protein